MLLKKSLDRKEKEKIIKDVCGPSFSIIHKLKQQLFGSPRYRLIQLYPDEKHVMDSNDVIYCNLELKEKGIALYFRFMQDEYAIVARYNQTTFQTNQNQLDLQLGNYIVQLDILSPKSHQTFIQKLIGTKSIYLESTQIPF